MVRFYTVLSLFLLALTQTGSACTAVSVGTKETPLLGKSYDWDLNHGFVLVNKRNVKKSALVLNPSDKPANWTSKYGSTTFNQYGQEFPLGGVNEKGLAVEILWLDETEYPEADERTAVNELQWIQYQLDNYSSVAEVVANVDKIRISAVQADVHYMTCDSTSACATIEFLDGESVVHTGEKLPFKLITNDTYEHSVKTLKKHVGFGGNNSIPQSAESLDRFVRAASLAKSEAPSLKNVFGILAAVKQGSYSVWNMVYDLSQRTISFRTHAKPKIRQLDTRQFDYSCKTPVLALDVQKDLEGDVTQKFSAFKTEDNRKMVEKSLPGIIVGKIVKYPSTTQCQE